MIKRKEFLSGDFKKRKYLNRREHPISVFLRKNKGYAVNVEEIARKIRMNKQTVRSMLGKLINDKLVLHKSPYFAWK